MSTYVPIIGLEIHAEMATKSKLFCRCANTSSELNTAPNTAICPVCVGLPGALPVINKKAVESTVKLGQAMGSTIPTVTKWDRKNYFYPDLPKGYQISQYDEPLCVGGAISWFDKQGQEHSIALTRIHLEEDTGKLTHPAGADYSLIDYNRSSIPLLELVTEPVIGSAEEAKQFAEEYQHRLRELGVAEANMEKGEMRCEANISVIPLVLASDPEKRLTGVKIEVKNLNSFRSLERAINYEIERQIHALESEQPLHQETRGWNETKGETYAMRIKETSDDYRYFPEPDLYSLDLTELKQNEPVVGSRRQAIDKELRGLGVNPGLLAIVLNDKKRLDFYAKLRENGLSDSLKQTTSSFIAREPKITEFEPDESIEFFQKYADGSLSPAAAKEVLARAKPGELVASIEEIGHSYKVKGLDEVIDNILNQYEAEVSAYKAGKTQLFGFFVGQVRQALGGKGDPVAIAEGLRKRLE